MKSPKPFHFKEFSVSHHNSSMKVGIDGVLIGAWGDTTGVKGLDVGCGCGLIALMAAQRNSICEITGIDIDTKSVEEAIKNVNDSPWKERITIELVDAIKFAENESNHAVFDFIISNPPFFNAGVISPHTPREKARHEESLSVEKLLHLGKFLLKEGGTLSFIMPNHHKQLLIPQEMQLIKTQMVADRMGKEPKRILLTYRKKKTYEETKLEGVKNEDILYIRDVDGNYTHEYRNLTANFYIAF